MDFSEKLDSVENTALKVFEGDMVQNTLNDARKAGEGICKAIILKHFGNEKGHKIICGIENVDGSLSKKIQELTFHRLIETITKDDSSFKIIKDNKKRQKVLNYLESIRTHGNPASHDPNDSKDSISVGDGTFAKLALTKLLHWFYGDFLTEPVPTSLQSYINDMEPCKVETNSYGDTRGVDIVKLCYPKQKVTVQIRVSDYKKKIAFEFVTADISKNTIIGYLFIGKNVSLVATMPAFISQLNTNIKLTDLLICTPRVLNVETGREVNRIRSIKEKFELTATKELIAITEYQFIDDFMWEHCLSSYADALDFKIEQEKYFIDQEFFIFGNSEQKSEKPSLKYLEEIIGAGEQKNPVNVILGPGGVGKTTFCEQAVKLINTHTKKRALYISSTDFRHAQIDYDVKTVTDLYKVFVKINGFDDLNAFEPSNLEINISCGNIILIIDGLDEIESFLAEKFDRNSLIESAIHLNEIYNNCSIIITSRDYHEDFYSQLESVNVLFLKGFNQELVDKYLAKRLIQSKIKDAKKHFDGFGISEQNRQIPLYISLICDLTERELYTGESSVIDDLSNSKYFISNLPIDRLIYNILLREIGKQSLNISCDDYFDLLAEIVVDGGGVILKDKIDEFIQIYFSSESPSHNEEKFTKFYVSPFIATENKNQVFRIKYDYVGNWIKVRYFIFFYKNKRLDSIRKLLIELSDGSSVFLDDLSKIKKTISSNLLVVARYFINVIIENCRKVVNEQQKLSLLRRQISGLLYFLLYGDNNNRDHYTSMLVEAFGSKQLQFLSIYGNFFPMDFTELIIRDGWFEQYAGFEKCKFPAEGTVFYYCTFKEVDFYHHCVLSDTLFDSTCKLSDELRNAVNESRDSLSNYAAQVKANLIKVLKIGFRAGEFSWKSESVYKNINLQGGYDLDTFIRFLISQGVLEKVQERSGKKFGYLVMNNFKDEAKYLITNNIVKPMLEALINNILKQLYKIAL